MSKKQLSEKQVNGIAKNYKSKLAPAITVSWISSASMFPKKSQSTLSSARTAPKRLCLSRRIVGSSVFWESSHRSGSKP